VSGQLEKNQPPAISEPKKLVPIDTSPSRVPCSACGKGRLPELCGQKKRRRVVCSASLIQFSESWKNYPFMRFRIPPASPSKPEPSKRREAGSGVCVTVPPYTWNDSDGIEPRELSIAEDGPLF